MKRHTIYFVGIGLYNEKDLTVKAKEILSNCDQVFAEFYTSVLTGTTIQKLEQAIGKKITILTREQTENPEKLFTALDQGNVAFVTGGDSMAATTHVDLRVRATTKGYHTVLIHGTSILTAVPGLLGLQHYKFGRTTTLVTPEKNYFPTSPYDVIKQNKSQGLHTLILLDIQQDKKKYMTATQALKILLQMEDMRKEQVINPNDLIGVVARAGSDDPLVVADTLSSLQTIDFGSPLHTIVYPGTLHFMEKEALTILTKKSMGPSK